MKRRLLVGLFLGLVATAGAACGSVRAPGGPAGAGPAPAASGDATVSGHVYWPGCPGTGTPCPPVQGIPVHFSWAPDQTHVMTTSDASGAYSIRLSPGTYVVIAGHADRSLYARRVTVRAGEALTLDLPVSPATGAA